MSNAVAPLWSHAQARPDEVALRIDDREWTFGELRDHSARWAARLVDAGLQRGERVLLAAGTRASWVFAYHGILAAGGIAVTVNPASTVPELQYFMADSGARIALSAGDDLPRVVAAGEGLETVVWDLDEPTGSDLAGLDPVDVDPSDGAVIMYTSGTTGKPKGAQLTHHGIGKGAEAVIQVLEMTPEDKVGTALPLFHVFGQVTVMRTAYEIGVPLTLRTKFDAETLLRTAAAYGITILAGVPTMWNAMVNTGPEIDELDLSSLRLACSGGAGLPMRVAEAFEERFDCPILAGYGLTETAGAGACPPSAASASPRAQAWPGRASSWRSSTTIAVHCPRGASARSPSGAR